MNKEKYLEELYNQLLTFEIASPMKHVTEYDYIIEDMLEEQTIDEVIAKLGTPTDLANSIAKEFNYQPKGVNQYSEPITGAKQYGGEVPKSNTAVSVINVLFIVFTVIYIISTLVSGISVIFTFFAIFAIFETAFPAVNGYLAMGAGITLLMFLPITIYMIILNLKRKLIIYLNRDQAMEVK